MESDLFDRGRNKTRLGNATKYAGRRKRYGNTGAVNLITTPNVIALILLLTGILAASASLLMDRPAQDDSGDYILNDHITPTTSSTSTSIKVKAPAATTTTLLCTSCPDGTVCGQVNSYGETCQCTTKCDDLTGGCKNTCRLAGTLAAAKKATTTTTSTTSTTSSTVACGGDLQSPCKGTDYACNEDSVLGSDGICHTPLCLPSVESGLSGCGAFALEFCRPGHPYKYVKNLEGREIRSDIDPTKDE
jgi:hypothetical protein